MGGFAGDEASPPGFGFEQPVTPAAAAAAVAPLRNNRRCIDSPGRNGTWIHYQQDTLSASADKRRLPQKKDSIRLSHSVGATIKIIPIPANPAPVLPAGHIWVIFYIFP
jgi:hypothetical protein